MKTKNDIYECISKKVSPISKIVLLFTLMGLPLQINAQASDGALLNTGKMYVGENTSSPEGTTLYIDGDFIASGSSQISQVGKTILANDFINNVTSENIFLEGSQGSFEFKGNKVQHIRGSANRENYYINFPKLIINNRTSVINAATDTSAVIVSPLMGVTANHLEFERGRLILDSYFDETLGTQVAHLLVKNNIVYPDDNLTRTRFNKGLVQVNMKLNPDNADGRVMGFASPFKKIYSDYFVYNMLSIPAQENAFGVYGLMNKSTDYLTAGKGYLLGLGVIPLSIYNQNKDPRWYDADPAERLNTSLTFARDFGPLSLLYYITYNDRITDKFTEEDLHTGDLQVTLEPGLNFLGNPFTVPLDMRGFLKLDTQEETKWGQIPASVNRDNYLIITPGEGTFTQGDINDPRQYRLTNNLQVVGRGGTAPNNPVVGPMQVFAVTNTGTAAVNLTIPASARAHGQTSNPSQSTTAGYFLESDEFLIETRDKENDSYDRLTILFDETASHESIDRYDTEKVFNETRGVNQIYTSSSDDKKLVINAIPLNTAEMKLYFRPAYTPQELTFKIYNTELLQNIHSIMLTDHKTGDVTDLLQNNEYSFFSSPTDNEERFTLTFNGDYPNTPQTDEQIKFVYKDNVLSVYSLTEEDLGSIVSIYSVQGTKIVQYTITDAPNQFIPFSREKGIYIVKLNGKNNVAGKFIIK